MLRTLKRLVTHVCTPDELDMIEHYPTRAEKLADLWVHVVGLMLMPQFAMAADASACYNIADADARTYCLARAHRQPGQCYSIQNPAMRSMCLSEVRK